jgi:hypothetical protein
MLPIKQSSTTKPLPAKTYNRFKASLSPRKPDKATAHSPVTSPYPANACLTSTDQKKRSYPLMLKNAHSKECPLALWDNNPCSTQSQQKYFEIYPFYLPIFQMEKSQQPPPSIHTRQRHPQSSSISKILECNLLSFPTAGKILH